LINNKRFDRFLSIVLSKAYIISELKCSEVDAAEKQNEILGRFNMIFCLIRVYEADLNENLI